MRSFDDGAWDGADVCARSTIGAVAATLSLVGTSLAGLVLGAILLARFPDGRDRGRLAALADVTALPEGHLPYLPRSAIALDVRYD